MIIIKYIIKYDKSHWVKLLDDNSYRIILDSKHAYQFDCIEDAEDYIKRSYFYGLVKIIKIKTKIYDP